MKKGLVHIYTGKGKGKTSAAVGLAVRAIAHGFKILYANFNKGDSFVNTETEILKKLGAVIRVCACSHPDFTPGVSLKRHAEKTREALNMINDLIKKETFDLLVLDEILISVRDGFIEEEIVLDFIRKKPSNLELVLTGRGATGKLTGIADYVSEIDKIKHPFDQGISAREGIEF